MAKHYLRLRGDYPLQTDIGEVIAPHNAIFESFNDEGKYKYKRLLRPGNDDEGPEYDNCIYFIGELAQDENLFEELD